MCLFYFMLFHYYSFDACFFSNERQNENRSRWDGREEEMGDVDGGETVIKIILIKNPFSIKEKRKRIISLY